MGWVERAIKRGVDSAIRDFCKPGGDLDDIIERQIWRVMDERIRDGVELSPVGFLWALRLCFHKRGCTRAEAVDLANSTLTQLLADEKMQFGDPDWAWTRGAAADLAEEYEFRYWEAA